MHLKYIYLKKKKKKKKKKKPCLFDLEVISKTQGSLQPIVCRFQYGPLLAQYLGLVVIPKTPAFFMPLA
jgi:hypothetical protein